MKATTSSVLIALALGISSVGMSSIAQADASLNSDAEAKLSRIRAETRHRTPTRSNHDDRASILRYGDNAETPCGAIDLGNVENASLIERSHTITLIIDGDVINANNNCR